MGLGHKGIHSDNNSTLIGSLGSCGIIRSASSGGHEYSPPSGSGPSYGTTVLAQWLFDEASGNITDEVNGVELTASGTPIYESSISGAFSGVSPGIDFNNAGSFGKATATSELDIGAVDFYIKIIAEKEDNARSSMLGTYNGTEGILFEFLNTNDGKDTFLFIDDGSLTASCIDTMSTDYVDGDAHIFLITADRNGNATVTVDGVAETSADCSGAPNAITANNCYIGDYFGGSRTFNGKIYELHVSEDS